MPEHFVIAIDGPAGSGKSTTAATIFSTFKNAGISIELVREYIKDALYEGRTNLLKNQLYILAKQYKRMKDIQDYGTVPIIVTDSPLQLQLYYCKDEPHYQELTVMIGALSSEFDNCHVFVNRASTYDTTGRYQTEKESDEISEWIYNYSSPFDYECAGDAHGQYKISQLLLRQFKENMEL